MLQPSPAQQFSALGNELRLEVFRFVIQAGTEGRPAGEIAQALDVAPSTLSSHLAILAHCGLLTSRRDRQRVIYAVDPDQVQHLIAFLLDDCCQGQPELCGFGRVAQSASACC
jgi:DNA-binding transcriptional ArsR family regulator